MRAIGIEYLRKVIGDELCELPFIIMRRGVKIAIVEPYSSDKETLLSESNLTVKPYSSGKEKSNLKVESKQIIKKLREEVDATEKPYRAVTHHRGE